MKPGERVLKLPPSRRPVTGDGASSSRLFVVALFLNARAAFKLALDWKGMLTTLRFVRDAYARLDALPSEEALEREPRAPVFLHLVPAYQEPDIAETVKALVELALPARAAFTWW